MRIAAVADLHVTEGTAKAVGEMFKPLIDEADALLLAGDLSTMGRACIVVVVARRARRGVSTVRTASAVWRPRRNPSAG